MTNWPKIIQGGMGAGISSWPLARAVSSLGQLGVVSGVALDTILVRKLQDGDECGSIRRALDHFPVRSIAERILDKYFVEGGREAGRPYALASMHTIGDGRALLELCIVAAFVEVFLAREGHSNPVGINLLEKVQMTHLPLLYGAMLAGVAVVLMGAGIPIKIPGVLDRLSRNQPASYEVQVTGADDPVVLSFDPREVIPDATTPLTRPYFFPIVSSNTLATTMVRRSNGRVDGFVIEGPTAGGHNAPPRGRLQLDSSGQPVYGDKDAVDIEKIRDLGLPFWLAGGRATRERLREAIEMGAAGVQVGTAFALCEESGLSPDYRRRLLEHSRRGTAQVFTEPDASPTGFPFKVARLEGSLSERDVYENRKRVCDLGYLREVYRTADGRIAYRCPAEPVDSWIAKGGDPTRSSGKKCLCNALVANIGLGQVRTGGRREAPLITMGDDLADVARFLPPGGSTYTAHDVIASLLG